ncbi:hypothetical protein [Clostridium butyricum]|uniref:hypothetical protein n=1 Tax=Clostridium butyricum TaxID=1492 RepID=UPI0011DE23E2|nr:hypothetical protein [Clostridium butyricum]
MIHTVELYKEIEDELYEKIKCTYGANKNGFIDLHEKILHEGINVTVLKAFNGISYTARIKVFVDAVKLFRRSIITVDDRTIIENVVKETLFQLFSIRVDHMNIMRIDYRYDAVIEDTKTRETLFEMFNKSQDKCCHMKKVDTFRKENGKLVNNKSSSLRFENSSRCVTVYDKEIERGVKQEVIMDYEKNVMRFESQIKRYHIKYLCKKNNIRDTLENFMTVDMYNHFMIKVKNNVLHPGDYYNKYHACKIINASKFSEKSKNTMIEFITLVANKRTLSAAKERYSNYKFKKILEQLEILNVNQVTIVENVGITFIENPLHNMLIE